MPAKISASVTEVAKTSVGLRAASQARTFADGLDRVGSNSTLVSRIITPKNPAAHVRGYGAGFRGPCLRAARKAGGWRSRDYRERLSHHKGLGEEARAPLPPWSGHAPRRVCAGASSARYPNYE